MTRFAPSLGIPTRNAYTSCWAIMPRLNPSYILAHHLRLLPTAHQSSHQLAHSLPKSSIHQTSSSLSPIHLAILLLANGDLCKLRLPTAQGCCHHACKTVIFLWTSTLCITPMSGIMQQSAILVAIPHA